MPWYIIVAVTLIAGLAGFAGGVVLPPWECRVDGAVLLQNGTRLTVEVRLRATEPGRSPVDLGPLTLMPNGGARLLESHLAGPVLPAGQADPSPATGSVYLNPHSSEYRQALEKFSKHPQGWPGMTLAEAERLGVPLISEQMPEHVARWARLLPSEWTRLERVCGTRP